MVEHITGLRHPGQAQDFIAHVRDAFAKHFFVEHAFLQHLARRQFHLAQGRLAVLARAFIQMAILEQQTLGKCLRVVRIGILDEIAIDGDGGLGVAHFAHQSHRA
ncbi:hypothetical protein D3C72_1648130 [compost metagenome]